MPEKSSGWTSLSYNDVLERAYSILNNEDLTRIAKGNLSRLLMDLAMGPYENTEKFIKEIQYIIEQLEGTLDLGAIMKFRQLVEHNQMLINVIEEEV